MTLSDRPRPLGRTHHHRPDRQARWHLGL